MATETKFVALGAGTGWTTPTNIYADDTAWASVTLGVGTTNPLTGTMNTNPFTIPTDATVDGFQVIMGRHSEYGVIIDNSVKLVKAGSAVGNDIDVGATWQDATDRVDTLGSATEKGGQTWTPAEVNATNFGVSIIAEGTGDESEPWINYVKITCYYTPAAAAFVPKVMMF